MPIIIIAPRAHEPADDCWCQPAIVGDDDDAVLVHNDEVGAYLGTHPLLVAEHGPED